MDGAFYILICSHIVCTFEVLLKGIFLGGGGNDIIASDTEVSGSSILDRKREYMLDNTQHKFDLWLIYNYHFIPFPVKLIAECCDFYANDVIFLFEIVQYFGLAVFVGVLSMLCVYIERSLEKI